MREQIRVRIDSEQWESWREGNESNTELLDRILKEWQQQHQTLTTLTTIDPNPSQALGRLLTSHELLSTATVTIHPAPLVPTKQQPASPPPAAISEPVPPASTYAHIDGIENNGDDW